MRLLITLLLASCSLAIAGSAGEATDTPDVIARVVSGLANSEIAELTSRTSEGGSSSYHLKTIDYLGTVQRDGRRYTVALAQFLRSSKKGSEYPPARGHGFLVLFDDTFRVVTYGRMDFEICHMEGDVLKSGDKVIVNFGATDPATRHHGWLLDSAYMPYPFSDRISEADWQSGKFRSKQ